MLTDTTHSIALNNSGEGSVECWVNKRVVNRVVQLRTAGEMS